MIFYKNTVISEDIKYVCFACDMQLCKGACCEEGDAGAPLEKEEIQILKNIIELVKPYMNPDSIAEVEKNGIFDIDNTGDIVTPLVKHKQCVFVFYENDIALCAIEKAYLEKKINFRKPISCHLYPIRIKKFNSLEWLNYHYWHVCKQSSIKEQQNKIPLYKYLKEPLIRKYGKKWYDDLMEIFIKE